MNRGRPPAINKDPDRPRVRNLNGRLIDVGGLQYCALKLGGYTIENKRFIDKNQNYTNPKIKNYNGSMIEINGATYKDLLKTGYKLNEDKTQIVQDDSFVGERVVKKSRGRPPYVYIRDPKNIFHRFMVGTDSYNEYIGK